MDSDNKELSPDQLEKIRLGVLNALSGEPIKHYTGKKGEFFYSDTKDGNPYSRHNVVLRNLEP